MSASRSGAARLAVAGGCGSSGTTLLAHLLGRHSRIVSTPELDFFNHPESASLSSLAASLDALFGRRRLSGGYKLVVDFCKPGAELGIDEAVVSGWLAASNDLSDLCAQLAAHVCRERAASWYFEKTPTNVYTFAALAPAVPEVPLIHQIRDGRDVVASLRRRGKSLFHAASRWLYDTVSGLRARGQGSYRELRYEDLVSDPRAALTTVLGWLDLELEPAMLETEGNGASYTETWRERDAPRNWNAVPSDPISTRSIGSHRRELSDEDLSMVLRVRLTDEAAAELGSPVHTFAELLELLGYDRACTAPVSTGTISRVRETTAEIADQIDRARRSLRYTGRLVTPLTYVGSQSVEERVGERR